MVCGVRASITSFSLREYYKKMTPTGTDPVDDDDDGAERSSLQEVLKWIAESDAKHSKIMTTKTTIGITPKLEQRFMKVLVDSKQDCELTSSHVEFSENSISGEIF